MTISLSYKLDKRLLFPAPISSQTLKSLSRNATLKWLLKGNKAHTGLLSFQPASIWYRAPFEILPPMPVQQGIYLTDYLQITHPYNSNSTHSLQLTSHTLFSHNLSHHTPLPPNTTLNTNVLPNFISASPPGSTRSTIQDPFRYEIKIKQLQKTLFPVFIQNKNSTVNAEKGTAVHLRVYPHEDYFQEESKIHRLHLSPKKPEPNS
ncbi:hypothetical protein Glove_155g76 [Diversispora epigaea]|uniref:Uncharacterized protein n=1 Tax=Diversispora epigaea TaxID=1348612 RepID=A0A397J1Q4_9GLOM|nr:hypothetical protein Glove_155g76 [Diversispora epigaea]